MDNQKTEKEVEIRLTQAITANVDGTTHSLPAGRQRVPQSVADNWFVKAYTDNDGKDEQPDTRDAQIIELSTQNGQLRDALHRTEIAARNSLDNERVLAELDARLRAMTEERDNMAAERDELAKKVTDLQSQVELAGAPKAKSK